MQRVCDVIDKRLLLLPTPIGRLKAILSALVPSTAGPETPEADPKIRRT